MKPIAYGRQDIDADDIAAVVAVLRSDWLTQGPLAAQFEDAVAASCGAGHAVAVNSATAALHLAYRALGVREGSLVWTVPNTFVATANAALYCGARVDFVDIDAASGNLDTEALERRLAAARTQDALPDVVAPVHFAGLPCDMRRIKALSNEYGFRIVEDASHAIGARYAGTRIGDGAFSDITVFSFHPVKIITAGEGGMALTQDAALAATLRLLRSHGITRDAAAMHDAPDGGWYYEQVALGYNYRMTDIHAALGLSQLGRLENFLARRRELAARYDAALAGCGIGLPARPADAESAWHLYVVQVPERKRVYDAMRAAGIGVNVHYIPVYRQPYYRDLGFRSGDFPASERHYAQALSLPLFAALTDAEQDYVIDTLKGALRGTGMPA